MKAIYFPMTFISDRHLTLFRTHFQKTFVYQPCPDHVPQSMQDSQEDDDSIGIRIPVQDDDKRLGKLMAECKNWIVEHEGSGAGPFGLDLFDNDKDQDFDEQFSVHIKSAIKKSSKNTRKEVQDPLFAARFFLLTAQEFDIQQAELGESIKSISGVENKLFEDLKGGKEDPDELQTPPAAGLTGAEEPGSHMSQQRITAWYTIFQKDESPPCTDAACIFLTVSRPVFETVMEKVPADSPTLLLNHLPTELQDTSVRNQWQTDLSDYISNWINHRSEQAPLEIPEAAENSVTLQLVCLPGELIAPLFSGDTESSAFPVCDRLVVGLIETV